MKPIFYLIIAIVTIHAADSQSLSGIIQSSENGISIEGAHILNLSKNEMAISSALGGFELSGELGDTLLISNINYYKKQIIVNKTEHLSILLKANLIQLDEVVVSNLPQTEADFRNKLINMPMQFDDKFVPYGVKPAKRRSKIPPLYDQNINSGVAYAIRHPIRSIAKKLDKGYQEKIKYYALKSETDNRIIRNKKFNSELIMSITELEINQLPDFVEFLNLSDDFIDQSSAYDIAERIKRDFEKYQKINKVESN